MIGPDPDARGGIASVLAAYRRHNLLDGREVRHLVSHRPGGRVARAAAALAAGLELGRLLLRGEVKLLHAHAASGASFARKSAYLAMARAFGRPTIFHLHGGGFRRFFEAASPRRKARIVRTLERSSAVVALSPSWAAWLQAVAPGARILIVGNPVDVPTLLPAAGPAPLAPGAPQGVILYLGHVSRSKGAFDLVDALAEPPLRDSGAQLRIAGEGEIAALQAHAQAVGVAHRVQCLGWVDADARARQLQAADVFALPSHAEGLPMAMLEAMAARCAVVATPVGGIPEVARDGVEALLVPVASPAPLAEALAQVLGDAGLRERLGHAARARVARSFAAPHIVARISALHGAVCEGPAAVDALIERSVRDQEA